MAPSLTGEHIWYKYLNLLGDRRFVSCPRPSALTPPPPPFSREIFFFLF